MHTTPPAPGAPPRRVLLVDDEVQVLKCLGRLLRRRGFEVRTTTSPLDALELLRAAPADVVIADFMMPEMTGTELLDEVHRLDPQVRRVLLTGYADLESGGGQAVGVHLVSKPWDAEELMRRCLE
jgi:response regulator RpfG family c-di-GMP phosphodiesterase